MAHIFFNKPTDLLTDEDKDALACILARKTKSVPHTLANRTDTPLNLSRILPVDLIIRGIDTQTGQRLDLFPFPATTPRENVPHAATLAGHLFYRGEVLSNIQDMLHMSLWSDETLLSYMTSNVDGMCCFSTFFAQTQGRLYEILIERAGEDAANRNEVKEAYLHVCLEYSKHPEVYDSQSPAQHQLRCVNLIKKYPSEITTRTRTFNRRLLKLAHMHVKVLRQKHWSKVDKQTQTFIDYIVPIKESEPTAPTSKKRRGPRGKKGGAKKMARADAGIGSDAEDETVGAVGAPNMAPMAPMATADATSAPDLSYDPSRINACLKDNALLQGLVQAMPEITLGSTVTVQGEDAYQFKDLVDSLPGLGENGGVDEAGRASKMGYNGSEEEQKKQLEHIEARVNLVDPDHVLIL